MLNINITYDHFFSWFNKNPRLSLTLIILVLLVLSYPTQYNPHNHLLLRVGFCITQSGSSSGMRSYLFDTTYPNSHLTLSLQLQNFVFAFPVNSLFPSIPLSIRFFISIYQSRALSFWSAQISLLLSSYYSFLNLKLIPVVLYKTLLSFPSLSLHS